MVFQSINQTNYIDEGLKRLGLKNCKPESTPADPVGNFIRDDRPAHESDEALEMKALDYRGIVGYQLYIAKQTRPEVLATVSQLSRFLETLAKSIGP